MKNKNLDAIIAENKQLRKMVKRIFLALNPHENNNPNKRVVVQWTPKEEAVVREEMATYGEIHRAYQAMKNRGLMRSESAVSYRWYTKLKNN